MPEHAADACGWRLVLPPAQTGAELWIPLPPCFLPLCLPGAALTQHTDSAGSTDAFFGAFTVDAGEGSALRQVLTSCGAAKAVLAAEKLGGGGGGRAAEKEVRVVGIGSWGGGVTRGWARAEPTY